MITEHTSLANKRILVTGGTTGIGRAAVLRLAELGAHILTFGRHEQELEDTLKDRPEGGKVIGMTADVANRDDLEKVFDAVDQKLGGLDILISNAAIAVDPIDEASDDEWRYAVETNFVGYLACTRAALKRMRKGEGGHLVFISSISAEIKARGESVYSATKAGTDAFAEALRKEVQEDNFRVSIIQPGSVNTDMQEGDEEEKLRKVAEERMLHADDVVEAIEFILTRPHRSNISNLRIEPVQQRQK